MSVTNNDTERLPPIHPGEILWEEFMVPLGLTKYRLAKETGITPLAVSEIIRGKRSITAATALRFGKFFGTTPEMWLNLQALHDVRAERAKLADELERIRTIDLVAV
jgi:addiction module HigA family antidote